jgi:hypothetical protein
MFRRLSGAQFGATLAQGERYLRGLGERMIAEAETFTTEGEQDPEENHGIPAGYTYLGQFIDHDLTFDPMSSLQKQNDPNALTDFRTPRFDLDCLYGRGPDDQPYLYDDEKLRFRLGLPLEGSDSDTRACEAPRVAADQGRPRALIGDPRNDENVVISQLHAIMLRFHNRMVEVLGATKAEHFPEVQRMVLWHYQWVVLHDFLPKVVGTKTVEDILPHLTSGKSIYEHKPQLHFFEWKASPYIPVEFSAAAYRFGHSMVRPIYRLNTNLTEGGPLNDGRRRILTPKDDKEQVEQGLNGFRKIPTRWAIDWRLFFELDGGAQSEDVKQRIQYSYHIDTSLVHPLGQLPAAVAVNPPSLAVRNLWRGLSMGLPSGQDVARYMGIEPIADDYLYVGKAGQRDAEDSRSLLDISKVFTKNAPLWYYILAEAQQRYDPERRTTRLGRVGGRIVAEVFIGLLLGDHTSFLASDPNWRPIPEFWAESNNNAYRSYREIFTMADLIKQVIEPKQQG